MSIEKLPRDMNWGKFLATYLKQMMKQTPVVFMIGGIIGLIVTM